MITTYYISGYICRYPYINDKLKQRIDEDEIKLESIPYKISLVLINTKTGDIIELGYGKKFENSSIYHSFSKKSNFFKLCRAVLGIRDPVKTCIEVINIEDFCDNYISYNDISRRWVKAAEDRKILSIINKNNLINLCINVHIKEVVLVRKIMDFVNS